MFARYRDGSIAEVKMTTCGAGGPLPAPPEVRERFRDSPHDLSGLLRRVLVSCPLFGIDAPTPADWIGIYQQGSSVYGYVDWFYTSCTTNQGTAQSSGVSRSVSAYAGCTPAAATS